MLPRCTVVLLLALAGPGRLHADDWPVARGPSHEPLPYRFDPKAPIPKPYLEDSPACVLYSSSTFLVEEDGTVEAVMHEVIRLNSRRAIERLGEYRGLYYDPSHQKLTLNEARVHKPDGSAEPVEPRHVHVRDVSTDFFVYDRDKQVVISFPNLQIGDVLEVRWTTRGKNPQYFGQFFTRYTFGDDRYPTLRDELRVRVPNSKKLTFTALNGRVAPVIDDDGKATLYRWAVNDVPEMPQDDSLPSRETLQLQVACSTFASWAEVRAWRWPVARSLSQIWARGAGP